MSPIEIAVSPALLPGIHAITLWPFIFYRRGLQDDITLRCHEYFHWRQALRWGVAPWYLAYVALKIIYAGRPPRQHPLEAPAYAKQDEVREALQSGESIQKYLDELGVPA